MLLVSLAGMLVLILNKRKENRDEIEIKIKNK